jgi:hydroxypyruvate reductase
MSSETRLLKELFDAAVAAASPSLCLPPFLPDPAIGRTVVIGAGKAAASMASAVEEHWEGALEGLVVTRYGHGVPCRQIEVVEASHPVPDTAGIEATRRMIELATPLGENDLVLALISGGGSALMTLPAAGISFEEKQDINRALLRSGANITEMNCVRKHLSAIKGGRLAGHCAPAHVECLMISDVPGDDPSTIASGPTVPDPSTRIEALEIIARYDIEASDAVIDHLQSESSETPKPSDPVFDNVNNVIVASAAQSLDKAARYARGQGVDTINLGDDLEGESRELGRAHAERTLVVRRESTAPVLILSGGETTVTVSGSGRGGRNVEYLLGLAIALDGAENIYALAADTDGIDGSENNAGALITPATLERARALGLDPRAYLAHNDAYGFFEQLGALVTTGPTLTNVNDFRAILITHP